MQLLHKTNAFGFAEYQNGTKWKCKEVVKSLRPGIRSRTGTYLGCGLCGGVRAAPSTGLCERVCPHCLMLSRGLLFSPSSRSVGTIQEGTFPAFTSCETVWLILPALFVQNSYYFQ